MCLFRGTNPQDGAGDPILAHSQMFSDWLQEVELLSKHLQKCSFSALNTGL